MTTLLTFLTLAGCSYAALYLLAVKVFPFRACKHCSGRGVRRRRAALPGRGIQQCPRCGGTGRTLRPARKILHRLDTDPTGRLTKRN